MKIIDCKIKFRNRFSKLWCKYDERNKRANCWCDFYKLWYDFEWSYWKTRAFRWCDWCKNYSSSEYLFWCCKDDERNKWISWSFWKCDRFKYRVFCCCCCWWDDWWSCLWNCWNFIFFSIEISSRNVNYFLRMMLTKMLVQFVFWFENLLAMFANNFFANCWLIMLQQTSQKREKRETIETRVILRRKRNWRNRNLNRKFRKKFRWKCIDQNF